MSDKELFLFLKNEGCCNICCIRYLGKKHQIAYDDVDAYLRKLNIELPQTDIDQENGDVNNEKSEVTHQNGKTTEDEGPAAKMRKWEICILCVGILQRETWDNSVLLATEVLSKKSYKTTTFACALSAPVTTLMREKSILLLLKEKFKEYLSDKYVIPIKEAWKWSFGVYLATKINKTLDSGAISPLLITFNMEYLDDLEELEHLKRISPEHFESRWKQKKRFSVDFTRRSVEMALQEVSIETLKEHWHCPPRPPALSSRCVSVVCTHSPIYLGGRYLKLSRELSQTPWFVKGVKMMESSLQEVMFKEFAELFQISDSNIEHRLKLLSAGREDVDVRCLGDGRPFAIEINDPTMIPDEEQLHDVCQKINKSGTVIVRCLKFIQRDDLTYLKQGEQSKSKIYDALCIKLTHSKHETDVTNESPIVVTDKDIENINKYRNIEKGDGRIMLQQKTPIRVLHRRPLLTRQRKILDLSASLVPGHPQLFTVSVRTEAGTYIKEWAHGDLGRTTPSLADAIGAKVDILALDVCAVELDWPK